MESNTEFGPFIIEPLEVLGVDQFADSAVIIKARFKTLPIKQWAVGREFNRRMKRRFDELGIEIPFPHQTLFFGVDKQGNAPPVHVVSQPNNQPKDYPRHGLRNRHLTQAPMAIQRDSTIGDFHSARRVS